MLVLAYYTILPYYTSVHYTGAVLYGTTQVMFCASLSVHKLLKFGSGDKAKYQYSTTHGLGVGTRLSTSTVLHKNTEHIPTCASSTGRMKGIF